MLFGVCGRAQSAAAVAAIAAAGGQEVAQIAQLQRAVACEAMQEHLWRLLLDWPNLLELVPLEADFVRWHGRLRDLAAGNGDMAALSEEIASAWLGLPLRQWLALPDTGALQDWWRESSAPAARLFASLDALEAGLPAADAVPLLPSWAAGQWLQAGAGEWNAEFAARPQWQGGPAETGALACHAQSPLLADVRRHRQHALLARVLARAYDMLVMASGDYGCLDSVAVSDGSGLAVAHTARGALLHRVSLEAGKVQDYVIVAPTEWNFHPQGALATALLGTPAQVAEEVEQRVRRWVLALDPCVEYKVEISRA